MSFGYANNPNLYIERLKGLISTKFLNRHKVTFVTRKSVHNLVVRVRKIEKTH